MEGIGREGHQQPSAERADHQADKCTDAVEKRAALAVAIEDGRTERGCRRTDAEPLYCAGKDQMADIGGIREQHHGYGIDQQPRQNDRTPTDIIRQASHGEQRRQQTDRIDRKHQRDHQRREMHALLVEPIERRGCAAAADHRSCRHEAESGHGPERRLLHRQIALCVGNAGLTGASLHRGLLKAK